MTGRIFNSRFSSSHHYFAILKYMCLRRFNNITRWDTPSPPPPGKNTGDGSRSKCFRSIPSWSRKSLEGGCDNNTALTRQNIVSPPPPLNCFNKMTNPTAGGIERNLIEDFMITTRERPESSPKDETRVTRIKFQLRYRQRDISNLGNCSRAYMS